MISVFRRALADFLRHRFLHGVCLLTIALAIFIVCAFALFFINAGQLMDAWQRGVRITAYLAPEAKSGGAEKAGKAIESIEGVESVSFISGSEGLKWLRKQLGDESALLSDLEENPLPDALEITPAADRGGAEDIERIAERAASLPEVEEVEYARRWLRQFQGIYNLFRVTAYVMAGLVFSAIMLIVANTMRLILYSRREEIEITRIIGADEAFIKYPLYLEAALLGLLGGAAGAGLLYCAYRAVMPGIPSGGLLPFFELRFLPGQLIAFILISGMFVGWLGCYFTIRRFLRA